jgi:hypothetical protein
MAGARGGLCPFGVAGHHLPYHPARLRQGSVEDAKAAIAEAIAKVGAEEKIAVLDLRPGRTASWTYRRSMAAIKNGVYLAAEAPQVAYDLWRAATVLSLGISVLDGWGSPAAVFAARDRFRLIQAEALESRTASLADAWLPVRPGTENALARAIAGEISPAQASALTGLAEGAITSLLSELRDRGPAVVIGNGAAALEANRALGALGNLAVLPPEAPVPSEWRAKAAPVTSIESVADRSIRALVIDESVPAGFVAWSRIAPKLAAGAVVVTIACSKAGYAGHARFALPSAVYPEVLDDFPPSVDSVAASFRLSTPLVEAPHATVGAPEWIAEIGGIGGNPLRERADAIHKAGEGVLLSPSGQESHPVKDVAPDDFWKALNEGAAWIGPKSMQIPARIATQSDAWPTGTDLPLSVVFAGERPPGPLVSPLSTKLYRESNLRMASDCIAIHPATAGEAGVGSGTRAWLATACGKVQLTVIVDGSVPRDVVQAPAHPALLDLCGPDPRAKVVRI